MIKISFKTNNGWLITQWLIGVWIKRFRNQYRGFGPGIYAELAYSSPDAFIDSMRRYAHDPGDFLGVFMCVNKAQRFDLNGAKTSDWMSLFDAHETLLNDFTVNFDNFRPKFHNSMYDSDKPSLLSNNAGLEHHANLSLNCNNEAYLAGPELS